VIAACRKSRVQPNVVFESGQFATILALVASGMGISAVPAMAIQAVEGCCYVPIASERSTRRIGAVMLPRHFATRAQRVFLKHLVQVCSTRHIPRP